MIKKPFAVFAVAPVDGDEVKIAVTTRDGADAGRIGLPGGKVDKGETPIAAAVREAAEEGWDLEIPADDRPIHQAIVEGQLVWWFAAYKPQKRDSWKESHRGIRPELASIDAVVASGYGNEFLLGTERALIAHAAINGGEL